MQYNSLGQLVSFRTDVTWSKYNKEDKEWINKDPYYFERFSMTYDEIGRLLSYFETGVRRDTGRDWREDHSKGKHKGDEEGRHREVLRRGHNEETKTP